MNQNEMSTQGTSADASTNGLFIGSDRVEGTAVHDPTGKHIGTIKRLMIDKVSGRVGYAIMAFGGFLGMSQDEYPIPWEKLVYDTSLAGYRTDITQEQLTNAPPLNRGTDGMSGDYDWNRAQQLNDYYKDAQ